MTGDADRATALPDLEEGAPSVAVPVAWNEDGSFERLREAASRSAHGTLPPSAFGEADESAQGYLALPEQPVEVAATLAPEPEPADLAIPPFVSAAFLGGDV